MIVDVVTCSSCLEPLKRTARMVKNGTRNHAGSCAAHATIDERIRAGRLDEHMAMMREASKKSRSERMWQRLAAAAPGVPPSISVALWERGYKAGYAARKRKRASGVKG